MARVVIPLQALATNGGSDADLAFTAADATNDHYLDNSSGKVLVVIKNADATSKDVVFDGVNVDDVTVTVESGKIGIAGPFPPSQFNQIGSSDLGKLFFAITADTSLTFAAIKLP